ncbi:hypothetical protein D3C75_975350 [compost metagenome]
MVAALRRGQHITVVFAEGQQRFLVAQPFKQGQAQGFARTFVLPCRILYAAVVEGLRLVAVVVGNERQGIGKYMLAAGQACAQGIQVSHEVFPFSNAACCSALASFWYWAFHSA